ncbi:MBL fold metallo-hydrolase [Halomonas campisalis]|uniref:MBL fold metallo-hydrolase n=1 Tax=Billgrantia campisalis TaxID=74661 RepID=A0ABS9P6B2_9GAMM|nr:alkyl sulfatase dimerization domain-containing protein [Halomonas campisalis]MCG6656984.1 MBL fold metallo-hydrolase [Halomonas campisalis]MDR5862171.1 alkyl sulfatase dimerization domain-containing protein [Halomonas campisalis]
MNKTALLYGLLLAAGLTQAQASMAAEPASLFATSPVPIAGPLATHSEEFREEVIEVVDGVYVAIGFALANSIMIEGDDGVIIVDTTESMEAAQRVAERFRAITDKPVKALIYTHSHPDHIFGAGAFVDPEMPIEVYAHETLEEETDRIFSVLQPVITRRSMFMYGNFLKDEDRANNGIGPFVDTNEDTTVHMIRPTHTFSDRLELTIAGVRMELIYAPGETDDQINIWLPDKKALLPGDNFYRAYPNLYTIRGTGFRDPKQWADSIDLVRQLEAEYLIPHHSRPIVGADNVERALTDYRDGIRYVYDQTLRMMNAGLTPDEIAHRLELPSHLAESPYLQEFYGKPEWSARMIYQGYLGWFDGNPSNLHPLEPTDRAHRLTALVGGESRLAEAVQQAAEADEHQWVLELTDLLLRIDPEHVAGKQARHTALRTLAEQEVNPNARHWYLTAAGELAGEFRVPTRLVTPSDRMLAEMPLQAFFDGLAVALDAQAAQDIEQRVVFEFPDLDEAYTYIVRRGVSELVEGIDPDAEIHVSTDSLDFKRLLAGLASPEETITQVFTYPQGDPMAFAAFLATFNSTIE